MQNKPTDLLENRININKNGSLTLGGSEAILGAASLSSLSLGLGMGVDVADGPCPGNLAAILALAWGRVDGASGSWISFCGGSSGAASS